MAEVRGVLVVDFGAQYAQLIARRVREAHVYSEIVPSTIKAQEVKDKNPSAIILSGGPSSVYAENAPKIDEAIFTLGVPIFGICYGFQVMAATLGGVVTRTGKSEFGRTQTTVVSESKTFGGLYSQQKTWMSHGDAVTTALVASTNTMLKTDGTAVCKFYTAPSGSFHIAVRNSNVVQTWSAAPQSVGSTPLTYDFSTAANKSYGDNMKDLGSGVFGFYSGDINQDDVIDGSDATSLDLDIFNSEFGVKVTDLNGDGSVDASDSTYYVNNSYNSIFAILP